MTIKVGHPLLLDNVWHLTNDPKKPGWRDWFRSRLLAWPDGDLVREAVVRPSSVPIVAALRNGGIQARLGESEEVCQGAVHAVSSAALALTAASLLTPDEADWLLRAVEVDQDWFR